MLTDTTQMFTLFETGLPLNTAMSVRFRSSVQQFVIWHIPYLVGYFIQTESAPIVVLIKSPEQNE